jgi:hypothetical protein
VPPTPDKSNPSPYCPSRLSLIFGTNLFKLGLHLCIFFVASVGLLGGPPVCNLKAYLRVLNRETHAWKR